LLVVGDEAKAGDKEDVLAHMASFYSAHVAGDADGIPYSTHTRYDVKGGLIHTADAEKLKARAKGAFASGLKINAQSFHENVEIYGKTAVFTCYQRVDITPPEGEPIKDTRRVTVVLAKQKGEWTHVHVHLSYLTPVNPD
jgi:ketosteroid isomerase-like protein